jgi:hypothetical protein
MTQNYNAKLFELKFFADDLKEEISYFTEMFYDLPFTKPFLVKTLDFSDETFLT